MPFQFYISSKSEPRGSRVISKDNPTPVPMRDFVLGNSLDTNLFVVDGDGGFETYSGDASYSVLLGIGRPGESVLWTSTSWTAITNGWNGKIRTDNQGFKDLFDSEGVNPLDLELEATFTDGSGNPVTRAVIPIRVWSRVVSDEDLESPPTPRNSGGSFTIGNGSDSGSVTGLGLSASPRLVLVTVRKPAGGLNIFASVVAGTISTGGFDFTLSGATDSGNYHLDYLLIY